MKSDEALSVILGDRRYRVERDWCRPPANVSFSGLSQLSLDSRGRVYLYQRSDPPVLVFEPSGAFLKAWGHDRIADAHGIFIAADDKVFLVDRDAHEILIFDTEGEQIGALGERHAPRFEAPFNHPTDAAVAPDGDIFVADGYGNSAVHRFSPEGELILTWGKPGSGPGEFSTPHAVWVDKDGRILVADRENDRIQIFDREGAYLDEWRDFYHPMDIFQDERGMTFVTDQIPRLSMIDPEGRLAGRCRAVWTMAHGISGNAEGDLFLAEMQPNRVTKLTRLS